MTPNQAAADLRAEVTRLTEEVEKWKGIASRIDDGLETLKENTDAEVDRLTKENARLKAQVAAVEKVAAAGSPVPAARPPLGPVAGGSASTAGSGPGEDLLDLT